MHACSAIINLFTEVSEEHKVRFREISSQYEDQLMEQLLRLLKSSKRTIQKEAITAFAAVTDHLGKKIPRNTQT
jgi:hypothetical protein